MRSVCVATERVQVPSDKTMRTSGPTLNDDQMQAIAHAVADPRRFAMLQTIARTGSVACSAVRCEHPISPATVSHHLKELETAGLIDVARDGRCINIALRRDTWDSYVAQLSQI